MLDVPLNIQDLYTASHPSLLFQLQLFHFEMALLQVVHSEKHHFGQIQMLIKTIFTSVVLPLKMGVVVIGDSLKKGDIHRHKNLF